MEKQKRKPQRGYIPVGPGVAGDFQLPTSSRPASPPPSPTQPDPQKRASEWEWVQTFMEI